MKTYTQEEILKITNKLFTDNRENEGADDIDKNPYAAGVHDGILDVLTSLEIDCEIPGRRKVVRGSNVQVLTSHVGLNLRSKSGYEHEARVIN